MNKQQLLEELGRKIEQVSRKKVKSKNALVRARKEGYRKGLLDAYKLCVKEVKELEEFEGEALFLKREIGRLLREPPFK